MARFDVIPTAYDDTTRTGPAMEKLAIRRIGPADLKDALKEGAADFWATPTHLAFLGIIYPIIGIVFAGLAFDYNMLPILFPLVSGFALVGPLAAIALYEISRRREQGLEISWRSMAEILQSPSIGSIAALGVLLLTVFMAWLMTAQTLYQSLFGWHAPASMGAFLSEVFTTQNGWWLIIAGNAIGFAFSAVVFCISAVSFPLLLDRDIGAIPAIITSIRAVAANPGTMLLWALTIAAALVVGFLPLFIGLAVVLPILGHASWHLYRKVVS